MRKWRHCVYFFYVDHLYENLWPLGGRPGGSGHFTLFLRAEPSLLYIAAHDSLMLSISIFGSQAIVSHWFNLLNYHSIQYTYIMGVSWVITSRLLLICNYRNWLIGWPRLRQNEGGVSQYVVVCSTTLLEPSSVWWMASNQRSSSELHSANR